MKVAVVALVLLLGGVAQAQSFDPEGWTLYAKVIVHPHEQVVVPLRHAAQIDEVALVVNGTGIELTTAELDGVSLGTVSPFTDSTTTWTATLASAITPSLLTLQAGDGEGAAFVRLYARDSGTKTRARLHSTDSTWQDDAWIELGKGYLDAHRPDATIDVKSWAVTALTLTASGGDLVIYDLDLTLDGGDHLVIPDAYAFDDTAREQVVAVATEGKRVTRMDFDYTISSGTTITLGVHGPNTGSSKTTASTTTVATIRAAPIVRRHTLASPTDDDGWTLLGEDDVDLIDDEIEIRKPKSTWSKLKIVAAGDDVSVTSIEVHPAGKKARPVREELDQAFSDGTERVIELPGKRRAIKKVRLQYAKHRLDASTRVKVYAR